MRTDSWSTTSDARDKKSREKYECTETFEDVIVKKGIEYPCTVRRFELVDGEEHKWVQKMYRQYYERYER